MNINNIITLVIVGALCFLAGLWTCWPPDPLGKLHREYNYITIYEDGSYNAETHDGQPIGGCLPEGECNE